MKFKKLLARFWEALKTLAFWFYPFGVFCIAILSIRLDSTIFTVIATVLVYGPYFLLMIHDLFLKNRQRKEHKSKQEKRELELTKREAEQNRKAAALNRLATELEVKAAKLAAQEAHINHALREREAQHVRNIAGREYLASSPAFRSIHTDPDPSRLLSSMTQDMKILPSLQITAKIRSESGAIYETSLEACSCKDFERRRTPCKHMYRLAAEVGALLAADHENLNVCLQNHAQQKQKKASDKQPSCTP